MKPENMTILTVDDTPANIRLLTHHLEKQGYKVLTAEDGFEGFKSAIQHNPDLILLDVMMPGTDGYEVCELLKAEEQTRSIPVMFLTAKADIEDRIKGFELGAIDYITKPFNLIEISTRVQNQLQMIHAQRQNERFKKALYAINPLFLLNELCRQYFPETDNADASTIEGLIQDWLSLAEMGYARKESFNLKYCIDDVMEIFQSSVSGVIGFNVEFKEIYDEIETTPGLIHLALLNLFINSYEAMDSKGFIHLRKEIIDIPHTLKKLVNVKNQAASYHKIDIVDNGIPDGRQNFNPTDPFSITDKDFKEFTLRLAVAHQVFLRDGGGVETANYDNGEFVTTVYLPVKG